MQANYIELEKRLWEAADELRGPTLNSSLPNIPSPFWGWFFCSMLTISLALVSQEIAAGSSRRRTVGKTDYQAKGALYLPETARFDYLIDRPEAEDIGGAINAAMKAIADENEELGGALPRNYNSLEKPILRELLKILNRIPRENITEDAFGEIYQYFLWNFAQKKGPKAESFLLPFHW
jgi:type I restriction enzyme M protein